MKRHWRPDVHPSAIALLCLSLAASGSASERSDAGLGHPSEGRTQARPSEVALAESGDLQQRVEELGDQIVQLRGSIGTQAELLVRLVGALEALLPGIGKEAAPALDTTARRACEREIAELNARLQQQQLAVDEAQRRAEKAEKLAAALDEAEARAETENQRLTNALATAKARQAEALQQTVQLERQLAAAEARLERDPVTRLPGSTEAGDRTVPLDRGGSDGDLATVATETGPPERGAIESAPSAVLYLVRPADTLSSISQRVYGDVAAWERIYEANRDRLPSPDALQPGMSLVIP